METILALNAGSSSVKFAVYEARTPDPVLLLRGMLDRDADDSHFIIKDAAGKPVQHDKVKPSDVGSDLTDTLLERIYPMLGGGENQSPSVTGSSMAAQNSSIRS